MSVAALPAARNPFRTERLDRLGYRDPATGELADLDPLVRRFEALGRRAAVVGPEGSGKTTLLDGLEPRFAARGFAVRRLRAVPGGGALRGPLPPATSSALWMIDGYDRLPLRDRLRIRRAVRGAAGLLVTTHRRPRMAVLHQCVTTPHLLSVLVGELAGAGDAAVVLPGARHLHDRHGGNVRTALLELYDRCAGRPVG